MAGLVPFAPKDPKVAKAMDIGLHACLLANNWESNWISKIAEKGVVTPALIGAIGADQAQAVRSLLTIIFEGGGARPEGEERILLEMKIGAGWSQASSIAPKDSDPAADLVLAPADRSSLYEAFFALYRFNIPQEHRPHDSILARMLRNIRGQVLEAFKLTKFKFLLDDRQSSSVLKLSADKSGLVSTSSESTIDGFRQFYLALRGLLLAYAIVGTFAFTKPGGGPSIQWCPWDVTHRYLVFVESKIFDAPPGSRLSLVAAMEADRAVRAGWSASLASSWSTFSLGELIENSLRSDTVSYFGAAIVRSSASSAGGSKKVEGASSSSPPKEHQSGGKRPASKSSKSSKAKRSSDGQKSSGPQLSHTPRPDSSQVWQKEVGGKAICRDYNLNRCKGSCGRLHVCAVCSKADCRAATHNA